MSAEEVVEARAELTRIASERVTWLAAEEMLHRYAAEAFRVRKDELAQKFRAIAYEFGEKAAVSSAAQDKQMRKLGMR